MYGVRFRIILLTLGFVLALGTTTGWCATVTVNPSVAEVPGMSYQKISIALANLEGGHTWGDGNDTILVTDDAPTVEDAIVVVDPVGSGSITIQANPGDFPVVATDTGGGATRLFRFNSSGTYVFDGLTLIGGDGVDANAADLRAAFWMECDDPGDVLDVTISNCVVTRNKGGNVPELDWSQPQPVDKIGAFKRAIYHGDDPFRGQLDCHVVDCVFGFITPDYACIQFDRQPDVTAVSRSLTIERTLITKIGNDGDGHVIRARDTDNKTTYNFIDSCITSVLGRAILIGSNDVPDQSPTININHCIMEGGSNCINVDVGGNRFLGTINIDGATLLRPGADLVTIESGSQAGDGNYSFKNLICPDPHDSVFRLQPDDTAPGSITVEAGIRARNPDTVRSGNHQSIKDAFAAVYGGTGPLTDDPMFVSTTIDASYAGIRKWDSTTNTLYDVSAAALENQGANGENLRGGAEHVNDPGPVPPTPTDPPVASSSVNDWNLYR